MYRDQDINLIKNTCVLLSACSLMLSVKARRAATISNLTWGKFLTSSVEVDSTLLQRISEEELKVQYREYVRRLERVGQDLANKELSDINLLELFLKPKNYNLYQDIKGVMSSMVRAALLISVESE